MALDFQTVAGGGSTLLSIGSTPTVVLSRGTGDVITTPTTSSFFAYKSTGTIATSTYAVFDIATYNYGNNYAAGTGIYTAPVAGIYLFRSSLLLPNSTAGEYRLYMYKNAVHVHGNIFYKPVAAAYHTIHIEGLVSLAASDTMRVYYVGPAAAPASAATCFSGSLVG